MKKTIEYKDNKLCVCYSFNWTYQETLKTIYNNDGCAEFENRFPETVEDVDGNEISWKICDDLVDIGLLEEDEEAYDVYYEITDDGKKVIEQILSEKNIN